MITFDPIKLTHASYIPQWGVLMLAMEDLCDDYIPYVHMCRDHRYCLGSQCPKIQALLARRPSQ